MGEGICVFLAVMNWGVGLCSVLQGGRCPENIGLHFLSVKMDEGGLNG